jgi:hypothetical protein
VVDESAADAAALGIKIEPAQTKTEHFEVWEENWLAVEMFLRVQTQWVPSMSGPIGLNYEVLLGQGKMFDLYSVESPRLLLEDLQIMELAALEAMRKEQ